MQDGDAVAGGDRQRPTCPSIYSIVKTAMGVQILIDGDQITYTLTI